MCEYCKMSHFDLAEKKIIKDHPVDLGIIRGITINSTIQDKSILSIYFMDSNNDVLAEYNTNISYCPYCGRKLGDEDV